MTEPETAHGWTDCPGCAEDMPDTQTLCDACIEDDLHDQGRDDPAERVGDIWCDP